MPFRDDLCAAINANSVENGSNTPDWLLRDFLCDCLNAWNNATNARSNWYGPPLTDEEREAIEASREFWQVEADCSMGDALNDEKNKRYAAILGNLLQRTSGFPSVGGPTPELANDLERLQQLRRDARSRRDEIL